MLSSQEYLNEVKKATDVIWLGRSAYVYQPRDILSVQVVTDQDLIDLFNLLGVKTRKYEISRSYDEWRMFSLNLI